MIRAIATFALLFAAVAGMAFSGPVGKGGIWFAVLYALSFMLLAFMIRWFPGSMRRQDALRLIVVLGIFLRLLFAGFPPSFDVNRYVWEGWLQGQGVNPYTLSPDDPALSDLAAGPLAEVWDGINHKDYPACYPPLAMLVFRLLAAIQPDPRWFKIVFLFLDIGALLALAGIFTREQLPAPRLLWYAANPLLLVFIAGEGHLDSLMVCLLVLGTGLVLSGRAGPGFFCIGCAAMAKYFAVLALVFLFRRDNWKKMWTAAVPLLTVIPFADAGKGVIQSVATFGTLMHYNDFIPALLRPVIGDAAVVVLGVLLAAGLALIFLTVPNRLQSMLYGFGWLILCLPTVHPWYLSLIAPFAAAMAAPSWLLLQATAVFTFPVLITECLTGVFQEIHWLKWLEYGPVALVLLAGVFSCGIRPRRSFRRVGALSVVIPTFNEAESIGSCLRSVVGNRNVSEVIAADGGSRDATCDVARRYGAVVVPAPLGRGIQIRAGTNQATGDAVLILHADSRLEPGAVQRVLRTLNQDFRLAGGAMAMGFHPGGKTQRIIAGLNNLRTRLTGIAFGDQAQFYRVEALGQTGGFPDQMLMEDVELSLRLKSVGRLAFLGRGVSVSARRWERQDVSVNLKTVLSLFARYLIERRFRGDGFRADGYYARYYGAPLTAGREERLVPGPQGDLRDGWR